MEPVVVLLQILVSFAAGVAIGVEREVSGHPAGVRTHALIAVGAAAFTAVGIHGFSGHDPSRVAAQVVTGIGFVGAGAILRDGLTVRGLTTAASLWVTAAIGVAFATAMYATGVVATVVVVGALAGLRSLKPLIDRVGSTEVVVSACYTPGHGTLGPLLRGLDSEQTQLVDLRIEDRDEPDAVRLVYLELRAPKEEVSDMRATVMALGDELPEMRWVKVDVQ